MFFGRWIFYWLTLCQSLCTGSVLSLAVAQKAIVVLQIAYDSFFLWVSKNKIVIIALNFLIKVDVFLPEECSLFLYMNLEK